MAQALHRPLDTTALAILAAGVPVSVIGFAQYPLVTLVLLGAVAWYVLRDRNPFQLRLFGWAALFGTVGEAICVYGTWWTPDGRGLWTYAFPSPLKLPIWLPLVWGNLFLLFTGVADRIAPARLGEPIRYLLMLAIICYAGFLYRTIDVRILWLFTPFFAAFILYWNSTKDLALFLVAAALGSFGEIIAMREGLWIYSKPLFTAGWVSKLGVPGIPVSLAMAWGLSAVFLNRLAQKK